MSDVSGGSLEFEVVANVSDVTSGAKTTQKAVETVAKSVKDLESTTTRFGSHARTTFSGVGAAIQASLGKSGIKAASASVNQLEKDILALRATFGARAGQFSALGIDPKNLALLQNQLDKLLNLQRRIKAENTAGTLTGDRLKGFVNEFESIRKGVTSETASIQSVIKNLTAQQTQQAQTLRAASQVQNELQKIAARAANSTAQKNLAGTNVQNAIAARSAAKQATQAQAAELSQQKILQQRIQQEGLNSAKVAGQQRVAITRATLETIGRLERATGAVVKGIASTTVGAIGKVWDGLVGSVSRTMHRREEVISGGLKNETRLFQQASVVQQKAQQGFLGIGVRQAAFVGGGLGLVGALKNTFTLGADFAQGLRVLQAQLGLTDAEMKNVRKTAIDLGNDITLPGVSAKDAAADIQLLAKQFASLGPAAVTAAQDAAKGTLQLQIATQATADEAARLVGASVNIFKIPAQQATQVADQIAQALAKSAGISVTEFTQGFTQAAAVFEQFVGPGEDATNTLIDFNTALAALAKGGLIGSDAGTSLRQFFLQANRGTDESVTALDELTKRAGETGSAFFTLEGKSRPFVDTLNILRRGLEGLTAEQRANTLQTLFGSDATRAASILLDQNGFEYQKLRDQIADSTGAAAKFANAQSGGLRRAFDAISSSIETAQIQIFEFVDKTLGPLALGFADFFSKLISGSGAFEIIRRGLLGVAAGLGAIIAVKVGVEVLGLLAKTLPLLITPFGLLSVLAAGLGAAFVIASKSSKGFSETLKTMGEQAKIAAGFLKDQLAKGFEIVGRTIKPVLDELIPGFKELSRIFSLFALATKDGGLGFGLQVLAKSLQTFARQTLADLAQRFPIVQRGLDDIRHVIENLVPLGRRLREFGAIFQNAFATVRTDGLVAGLKTLGASLFNVIKADIQQINFKEIGRLLSTNLGRALTGAGLGAVAGGVIAGPIGAALGAAIGAGIGLALPTIRNALVRLFTSIDPAALFGKLLDGVHKLGETIGKIISSKNFILGVAGIAAAAAAIAVQFITGFVGGIFSHLGQVAQAGAAILNALFDQNSIVKAVVALAILLRKQLIGAFTSNKVGEEAGKVVAKNVADGAAKNLPTTLGSRLKGLGTSIGAAFKDLGSKAANGLTVALSAGLSGSALGGASSNLEKGLGIAGVLGSVAAGASVAGPAGAAAAGGIALLTTAIAQNAKAAAEAKGLMLQYKDAITQTGDAGKGTADVLGVNLTGASKQVKKDLAAVGFTVEDFNKAIQAGKSKEFLDDLNNKLEGVFHALDSKGNLARNQNVFEFLDKQVKAFQGSLKDIKLDEALNPKGIGRGFDFGAITHGLVDIGTKAAEARRQELEVAKDLQAQRLEATLTRLRTKAENITEAAQTARTKLAELIAGQTQEVTPVQATDTAIINTQATAADVQKAITDGVFSAVGSAEFQQAIGSFNVDVGTAFTTALTSADPGTALQQSFDKQAFAINQMDVSPDAKSLLLQNLQADFDRAKENIPVGVGIRADEATAAGLEAQAKAAEAAAQNQIPIGSVADIDTAQAAGRNAQKAAADAAVAQAGDGIPLKFKAEREMAIQDAKNAAGEAAKAASDAIASGSQAAGAALPTGLAQGILGASGTASSAASTMADQTVQAAKSRLGVSSPSTVFQAMGVNVGQGLVAGMRSQTGAVNAAASSMVSGAAAAASRGLTSFNAIGRNIVLGIANGIRSASTVVVKAVTATAGSLVQTMQLALKIGSPSKVFMGIGEDVMAGLVKGIEAGGSEVVSAISSVATAMINSTRNAANSIPDALGTLFDDAFSRFAVSGGSNTAKAVNGFNDAIHDVFLQVAQNAKTLWDAASKEAGARSTEENMLLFFQEQFQSLSGGTVFGRANIDAITKAVDAIKQIGDSLLEQGFSAQQAADQLLNYRAALIQIATQAGIAGPEVAALIDSLGLSTTSLTDFVNQANRLNQIVAEGQRRTTAGTDITPLVPGPNAVQQFNEINLVIPHGDPQAVSLAVVNRLAQDIRR